MVDLRPSGQGGSAISAERPKNARADPLSRANAGVAARDLAHGEERRGATTR